VLYTGQEMTTLEYSQLHDEEIVAIRSLIRAGMKLVIETRQEMREVRQDKREFRKDMRAVADSQKRTEKNLAALIAALGRGTNGKH
jgi:hypothetical protein